MNTIVKEKQLTEEFSQGWAARSDLKPLSSCPLRKTPKKLACGAMVGMKLLVIQLCFLKK